MKALAFVLHSHLPYVVNHGTWPHGAEWLYEAAAECYVPLYWVFRKLEERGVRQAVTLGITPILAEQLRMPEFQQGFRQYLEAKQASAADDEQTFRRLGLDHRARVARFWQTFYWQVAQTFDEVDGDLVQAFARLQEAGVVEILTSAATHGYLPLLGRDEAVWGQVLEGARAYRRHFGRPARGLWPPELAYRPAYRWRRPTDGKEMDRHGVEHFYHRAGLRFFLVDHHLLKGGRAIGTYLSLFPGLKALWQRFEEEHRPEERERDPHRPYYALSPGSEGPVAFFTRDPKTAQQVWSRDIGYPGDPAYLEFHKKHFPSGHRYWRVTDAKADLADKQEYDPDAVPPVIQNHVRHFVGVVQEILARKDTGVVVSPFDTELFGHWWFEGPRWLEGVLQSLAEPGSAVRPTTLSQALEALPPEEVVHLPEGSWGEGGFHWVWYNDDTAWTWRHIHRLEDAFFEVLPGLAPSHLGRRLARQMARELLLLESSDWQFLITTWSARDYAEQRVTRHVEDLERLLALARALLAQQTWQDADFRFLETLEQRDRIFPDINPFEWMEANA